MGTSDCWDTLKLAPFLEMGLGLGRAALEGFSTTDG